MKKALVLFLTVFATLGIVGCGADETNNEPNTPETPELPGDTDPDETPGDTDPDEKPDEEPGDTEPGEPEIPEEPEEIPPALEDLLKDVVFEFRDGVEEKETILKGDFFDNQTPKTAYDSDLFYREDWFVQNDEETEDFNSMIPGVHTVYFALVFKGNDQFEKQEVMRISREITVQDRDLSIYDSPESITVNDDRILNEIYVDNSDDLDDAIDDVKPGDAIILRDGDYTELNAKIEANGTPENPIFIIAQNPGGAIFTEGVNITTQGAFITVAGLSFTGGAKYSSGIFKIEGNYTRVTNIKMKDLTYKYDSETGFNDKHSWVQIGGMYNEIDNSTFSGKDSHGVLMVIVREEGKEDHHHIHHNEFLDYTNPTELTNEFEVIRLGTSNESRGMSYTTIEYNLFDSMDAEAENISIKAGGNTIRGNVILNSASSITLRHGTDNIVEDNIIIGNNKENSSGIRVFDEGHIIRNNFISDINTADSNNYRGAIVLHAGNNSDTGTTSNNGQWTARDVLVEGNTIHNSNKGLTFENESDREFGPERITLKDNLIYSDDDTDLAVSYQDADKEYIDTFVFENNQIYVADNMISDSLNIFDGTNTTISNIRPNLTLEDQVYYLEGVGVVGLTILESSDVGAKF